MAQIIVRKLENDVVKRLKQIAKDKGTSLESEARGILTAAARPSREDVFEKVEALRASLPRQTLKAVDIIRADRDRDG